MAHWLKAPPAQAEPSEEAPRVSWGLAVGAVVATLLAVALVTGELPKAGLELVVVALIAVAAVRWLRSMGAFVCVVLAIRPLLDVGAGQRGSSLSITELFGVSVLVVCAFWLWQNRDAWAIRLRDRLSWALLALIAVLGLSTVGSGSIAHSVPLDLRMVTGFALYFVIDLLLAEGKIRPEPLLIAAAVAAVIAMVYPVTYFAGFNVIEIKDGVPALKSVFYLSNNFAHYLVPFIVVSAALVTRTRGWVRLFAVAFLATGLVELAWTETRGAWIAALAGLLLVGLLLDRRILLATGVGILLVVLFVPPVTERVVSAIPSATKVNTETSATWRLAHWDELLALASNSPVLGLGPDEAVRITGKEPHNDYLRSYVEWGVVGAGVFLWLLVEMVLTARQAWRRTSRRVRAATSSATRIVAPPWEAVVGGLAAFIGAFMVALMGENLIDNVTMLSVVLPALAVLRAVYESPTLLVGWTPTSPLTAPSAPAAPIASSSATSREA